ncbi:recombinase family protein [Bacillus capparidis]|uniref:DNA invertase Pin-like site-specific DNA recombinase n=1 Tax=Bacillus capparidis TaxID=1840411 RepID=A0ABS4CUL1_9BACI|nr:recombinase family protein [Bacillus capparidis]MBP1080774.1 DNA invertase Pin-like site-specific DNA recombinase [Bacillus capparidis]MED1094626.1 recombinase family protein [Bacillus capparidis]
MKYGYARVSTRGQAANGNSLEEQVSKLENEGCEIIYQEAFTGTKTDRPKFKELLSLLIEGDTLIVTKLDRFARSTIDGIETVKSLFEKGVKVHILNIGLVENTPTGNLIFTVMSAFAQFERDMIVERTQEGKAIAKLRDDFREGRPRKHTKKQVKQALKLLETHSYKEVEEMTGIGKRTLIRRKNEYKAKSLD